jgi:ABC-type proline/glycine betaine transport system substrate-binding protein
LQQIYLVMTALLVVLLASFGACGIAACVFVATNSSIQGNAAKINSCSKVIKKSLNYEVSTISSGYQQYLASDH